MIMDVGDVTSESFKDDVISNYIYLLSISEFNVLVYLVI